MYNKALNNIKIYLFLATVIGHLAITTLISAQEQEGVLGSKRKVPFALRGDLYFLETGTSQLPDFSELKRKGTIYAKELNVTPRSFREGFPGVTGRFEWFAIDYKGNFWIKEPGRYKFRLTSDDGAILFIDGNNLIDNDGVHPPRSMENSIDLRQGLHKIRVKYFQGPASEIALVLEMAKETGEYSIFSPEQMTHFSQYNWLEVLMETTTLIVTFALLAFMVERLTNGIVILLGYWRWWRLRMEVPVTADPDTQSRIDRNRKVSLFALSALLAVAGSILTNIDLLAQLGFANLPGLGGQIVTGLLVASGADPIRELIKDRSLRRQDSSPPSTPIQVTGTVVLQQDATSETQKAKLES